VFLKFKFTGIPRPIKSSTESLVPKKCPGTASYTEDGFKNNRKTRNFKKKLKLSISEVLAFLEVEAFFFTV
jgi:hypothetical protein